MPVFLRPSLCAWDWFRECPPGNFLSGESRRVGSSTRCAHPGGGTHRHGAADELCDGFNLWWGAVADAMALLWHRTAALRFSDLLQDYQRLVVARCSDMNSHARPCTWMLQHDRPVSPSELEADHCARPRRLFATRTSLPPGIGAAIHAKISEASVARSEIQLSVPVRIQSFTASCAAASGEALRVTTCSSAHPQTPHPYAVTRALPSHLHPRARHQQPTAKSPRSVSPGVLHIRAAGVRPAPPSSSPSEHQRPRKPSSQPLSLFFCA